MVTLVTRRLTSLRLRSTQPRFSSLLMTCDNRDSEELVRAASALIVVLHSGSSDSIARHR